VPVTLDRQTEVAAHSFELGELEVAPLLQRQADDEREEEEIAVGSGVFTCSKSLGSCARSSVVRSGMAVLRMPETTSSSC
jgi:hypothetical protein